MNLGTDNPNNGSFISNKSRKSLISVNNYEESKLQQKLGTTSSIIFLVKSAFGLGLFTVCYGFAKVGYIEGSIITVLMAYLVAYGIWSMAKLANEIEYENKKDGLVINTLHDTGIFSVKKEWQFGIKLLLIVSQMVSNIAVPVANTVMMSEFFYQNFEVNRFLTKSVIGGIYLLVIILCAETEKIKYLATPIFILYMTIALCVVGHNVY